MAVPACTSELRAGLSALSAEAEAAGLDLMQCNAASMTYSSRASRWEGFEPCTPVGFVEHDAVLTLQHCTTVVLHLGTFGIQGMIKRHVIKKGADNRSAVSY